MQVSGKILVLGTFALGFVMAGGAWWYNYQQSRHTAEFWGARDATLIVGSEKVELLELGDSSATTEPAETPKIVAGRKIRRTFDLTGKPGLVHLRHSLTYDDNFQWKERRAEPIAGKADWTYALRFSRDDRTLIVLFTADFARLGKFDERAPGVDSLPCPRLGPVLVDYLSKNDVGALTPVPR